jgi:hypothetical protein
MSENKYAILQEHNAEECETWLYFLKYNGNEANLKHMQSQLEKITWTVMDDYSTFDLELEYLVSEQTAKEMTMVELNHLSRHRKFDGILKPIDFDLDDLDSIKDTNKKNRKGIRKVNKLLLNGSIENYIDNEDEPENLDFLENSDISDNELSEHSSDDSSEDSINEEENQKPKKLEALPQSLNNVPRNKTKKKNKFRN